MGPSFTTSPRSPGAGKADGGLGHLLEELDLSLLAGGTEALAELWTPFLCRPGLALTFVPSLRRWLTTCSIEKSVKNNLSHRITYYFIYSRSCHSLRPSLVLWAVLIAFTHGLTRFLIRPSGLTVGTPTLQRWQTGLSQVI